MSSRPFPALGPVAIRETRDTLHAYARLLGAWLKLYRRQRKHGWHASLRPSVSGLTTGIVRAETDFELEIDLMRSQLHVCTATSRSSILLGGQSTRSLASEVGKALEGRGIDLARGPQPLASSGPFTGYEPEQAMILQGALASVAAVLEDFRAGIREETSPIQVWPHHFDLAMLWLPWQKIAGQDLDDAERSDKQLNFGFVFGDAAITEPYFYVSAYPVPEALSTIDLPAAAAWHANGFEGVVVRYRDLAGMLDPADYLHDLCTTLLAAGRRYLAVEA